MSVTHSHLSYIFLARRAHLRNNIFPIFWLDGAIYRPWFSSLPQVEEYFSMLPEKSVPRLGTPGERYRDRQLAFQLPKQDLARAYCRHLNPKHASSADDFMAARNEIALDIGSVQEVLERDVVSFVDKYLRLQLFVPYILNKQIAQCDLMCL